MDSLPDTLGLAATIAFLTVLALPYVLIGTPAVGVYYRQGLFGGGLLAVVALLCCGAFLLGVVGLLGPGVRSGVLVGFGVVLSVFTWSWAVTIPPEVVMGLPTDAAFASHRWVLAVLATLVAGLTLADGYRQLVTTGQSPQTV